MPVTESAAIPGWPAASVHGLLDRAARLHPSRRAVVHPDGSTTYAEVYDQARRIAGLLPRAVDRPEPVVLVSEHDPATAGLFFGVLQAGHAVVPVSARLPDEAIARTAASVGARFGLIAPRYSDRRRGLSASSEVLWLDAESDTASGAIPGAVTALPAGTAMVSYTSGSTGRPKGVIVTHINLVVNALTAALVFGLGPGNIQVNALPLAHFAGASRLVLAVINAGTHVLLPGFDPAQLLEAMARHRATFVTLTPTMAREVLLRANPEDHDLSALETIVYGTAPMPLALASELLSRFECGLINGYGLTESTGLVTALDAADHRRAAREHDEALLDSVGRAVPGVEMLLLDESGNEAAHGEVGEITLRGLKITPGYHNNPEANRERYLPGGWLRSGDLGHLTEAGNLRLVGRIDDMIISGGLNIQPVEIEDEAMAFEGISACAAFGVASERWGQEVRLAIVPGTGVELRTETVREFLRTRLDPYKVPKVIHIADELPRSSLGKVQRKELARRYRAGDSPP